jgi:hypothetical protein
VKHGRPAAGRGANLPRAAALDVTMFQVVPRRLHLFQLAQPNKASTRCTRPAFSKFESYQAALSSL